MRPDIIESLNSLTDVIDPTASTSTSEPATGSTTSTTAPATGDTSTSTTARLGFDARVVLVGGFGTRLRPLTLDPKPMLPVVDRPIVEWVIAGLAAAGVDEVVLALGFRPDVFGRRIPTTSAPGPACATRWSPSRWTRRAPSGSRRPGPASRSGSSWST